MTQNSFNNRVAADFMVDGDLIATGGLTASKQPLFVANVNPSLESVTGGGVHYEPIKYQSIGYDSRGGWNLESGKYTIPEKGVWLFNASIGLQNLVVGQTQEIDFHFELSYLDSGHHFRFSPPSHVNTAPGQNWNSYNMSWQVGMDKGWEIWTGVQVSGGAENSVNILALIGGNGCSQFAGVKLF